MWLISAAMIVTTAWSQTYTQTEVPPPVEKSSTTFDTIVVLIFIVGTLAVGFKRAKRANLQ